MEEKTLNEKESLDLIASMITKTQERFKSNGITFIIGGYLTVIVSLIVYFALLKTGDSRANYLWFLIPVCLFPLQYFFYIRKKKEQHVHTFVDSAIVKVWIVFGISTVLLMLTAFVTDLPILFIMALLMGMGTALTGMIICYPLLTICGFIGAFLSLACLFTPSYLNQILLFALIFFVMMVIPGHVLYSKNRKTGH